MRVLLTSVCRPLGERYGDAPSVGYELLFGQVTRAQGLFSPRATHVHFSLDYIAENLDAPTTVLQYPSRRELVRELGRGYDVVGVSFVLATFHRLKEVVALIREHSPVSRIVLGGYGTTLPDEVLKPFADDICREEGVGFLRRLLDEPPADPLLRHPLLVSRLRLFGREVSRTGMIFAGLGCPNGCDFCCTSHFFKRRHIRLLPSGRDIYRVAQRYLELEPDMSLVILDEDFLLDRRRALEFRDAVREGGRALSVFVFASIRAISRYTIDEILEMGIDGVWIGYEGKRSGYKKQMGRDSAELFRELRDHGISVLASMIVGFEYQTSEVIAEELDGLLALRPGFAQFLVYTPMLGTPFYDRVAAEGKFAPAFVRDPERYYRRACGFTAMVEHPTMTGPEIEAAQNRCFDQDFRRLGPSIYRSLEAWLLGYRKLIDSQREILRGKALRFARELRRAYPIFLAGRLFGPSPEVRRWIGGLEREIHSQFGAPTVAERIASLVALALAAWTGITLRFGWGQHPRLARRTYRQPSWRLTRSWRRVGAIDRDGCSVVVEPGPEQTVWVFVAGHLRSAGGKRLARRLSAALARGRERLVLDFARLAAVEGEAADRIVDVLRANRDRIRVALPSSAKTGELAALFGVD